MKQPAITLKWVITKDDVRIPPQTQVLVLEPPTVRNIQLGAYNLATYTLVVRIAVPALGNRQFDIPFDSIRYTPR